MRPEDYQISPDRIRRALMEQGMTHEQIEAKAQELVKEYKANFPGLPFGSNNKPFGQVLVDVDYGKAEKTVAAIISKDGELRDLVDAGKYLEAGEKLHAKLFDK